MAAAVSGVCRLSHLATVNAGVHKSMGKGVFQTDQYSIPSILQHFTCGRLYESLKNSIEYSTCVLFFITVIHIKILLGREKTCLLYNTFFEYKIMIIIIIIIASYC